MEVSQKIENLKTQTQLLFLYNNRKQHHQVLFQPPLE